MEKDGLTDGGAPALGEPLAIEFGNTRYAVRGTPQEGLAEPGHLAAWLRDHADAFDPGVAEAAVAALTPAHLPAFVRLRDTIRACNRAVVDGHPPAADLIDHLNETAALAPAWPHLSWSGDDPAVTPRTTAPPVDAALAAIARSAIEILGGSRRTALRACGRTGCILFFLKNHPRREWCSPRCGNRARVARHYDRHRPKTP
ncbi:CGNR zinc finger domain-containing protein [Thermomonospora amylolytica]|uniref:CGNR zinc finger domain-containing protein n=1 Tax=Thermomonospora amylolytica TaxID=1411117 RepID=UPI0018E5A984|nr:CGNR zinc finger domain-containing protein [Thermomonospora amylolytica]